jgi:hypothetical protein
MLICRVLVMLLKHLLIGRMFGMGETVTKAQQELFDSEIIPSRLAITALKDSGYKNTAYAIAELVDNAQQAGAKEIECFAIETFKKLDTRSSWRVNLIAVLDNGIGMDGETLRRALQFGNGSRLNDRSGIGRFGMGLPNSSISQAGRVDVWTWQNGPDNAIHSYLSVSEIENGELIVVPEPKHVPLPSEWKDRSLYLSETGTLVVWSEIDTNRLTWKSAKPTFENTSKICGRIYRKFITGNSLSIRFLAEQEDNDEPLFDLNIEAVDPLFLNPSPIMPAPFDKQAMFDHFIESDHDVVFEGKTYAVTIKYSVASTKTVDESGTADRGSKNYGKIAMENMGVSVVRADRELTLDRGWCIGYNPVERWWGVEVCFPPELDEIFGVPNNKQAATVFSELATLEWEQLAEEGEEFIDVINRLKEEGDPKGWLLSMSDEIKRNLKQLREVLRNQSKGSRPGTRTRHPGDDITIDVNEKWKGRSKDSPIDGEENPPSEEDLQEIEEDLTENKDYTEETAKEIAQAIQLSDLKVIFLQASFSNPFELFNVEIKGNVTEVIFNQLHPAFDSIFAAINSLEEDIDSLSSSDLLDRLTKAENSTKIIFAAWARYEREAGIDRANALSKVRFDWGQIAAQFLAPEGDL